MIASWIIPAIYLGLLLWLIRGWLRLKKPDTTSDQPKVSIIIVARNEAEHLPKLFEDLNGLNYPAEQLDIWLVDDHSEDDTAQLAKSAGLNVIRLSEMTPPSADVSFKKWGLTEAIHRCQGELILTTDADCRIPPGWAERMTAQFSEDEVFAVAGPVVMKTGNGLLGHFQQQDMLGMQLVTGGGLAYRWPLLANGANLAFRKSAFQAVDGYTGIDHLPTGDDILLLLKINDQFPGTLRYCAEREAVVQTQPAPNFSAFWQQRLRWVSKVRKMGHPATKVLMGTGWLFNAGGLAWIIAAIASGGYWWYGLPLLGAKMVVEAVAIGMAGQKLGQQIHWGWYPVVALSYLPYVALVGILGNFMPYRWKGRTIRPKP